MLLSLKKLLVSIRITNQIILFLFYLDWLQSYDKLKALIHSKLNYNDSAEILVVGCGNSTLSAELYNDGYTCITNLDFSRTLIEKWQEKYEAFEEMDFLELDLCQPLDVIDEDSFDMVIDKATLDSILWGQHIQERVTIMMNNIYRILAPGGVYICVSNGPPETREHIFKMKDWSIERGEIPIRDDLHTEDSNACHYVYVLTKSGPINM